MVMFVVIGAAVLAIVAVVWSDMAQRAVDDIDPAEIAAMRDILEAQRLAIDAVCTKTPELWR